MVDKFYTNPKVADRCIYHFTNTVSIQSSDILLEPSAGNGAFSNKLTNYTVYAYDIEPNHNSIIQQDFTTFVLPDEWKNKRIHVISNPPFGRQSGLAKKFIKKASLFASTISFILPKSFKKDSFRKTFPLDFHLEFEEDLPKNSFLIQDENGNFTISYDVPCVFQIWIRKDTTRAVTEPLVPNNFIFCEKSDNPHFSIRRVGGKAGDISENYLDKGITSHYFIRLLDERRKESFSRQFKQIVFTHDNTVGPRSISKQELIQHTNKFI